jgi:hypothetical protein
VQEIGDWLEKLGMPEYGERFAENDIDASVLPHLTDQSLKELSVSLGHRLKILAAIKELSGPTPAAPGPAVAPAEPKPQDTAERRQVTVLFSDLVGSTALSARMDPEDLREIISAYQRCVAETVDRFGGFVAKYMGDGVLVYFGYPQAHEDDAERAVRGGLEVISAVSALKVNRVTGEIALQCPGRDTAAETYFDRALTVARKQQAKSLELRAAMSMARLWRDQGKRDEACELLAPVYDWFSEGFDTLDLRDAKKLLDELSA